jgi:hypothetical protein
MTSVRPPDRRPVGARWGGAAAVLFLLVLLSACAKKPPADFAPDPGLVARITGLRMEVPPSACPGGSFGAGYVAILEDGGEIPFATSYDEDNPPALHVVFLSRYSTAAIPLANGGWSAAPDPLVSAIEGFRLRALLRANPSVTTEVVVPPDYRCVDHAMAFAGPDGSEGRAGGPGPNVAVRLAVLASPFAASGDRGDGRGGGAALHPRRCRAGGSLRLVARRRGGRA